MLVNLYIIFIIPNVITDYLKKEFVHISEYEMKITKIGSN